MILPEVSCSLCSKPVEIERAAVDEQGRAVHEECYARAMKAAQPIPSLDPPSPTA